MVSPARRYAGACKGINFTEGGGGGPIDLKQTFKKDRRAEKTLQQKMFMNYSGKSCFEPNISLLKRLPPNQFPLIKYPLRATTAILHPLLLQTLPEWGLARAARAEENPCQVFAP